MTLTKFVGLVPLKDHLTTLAVPLGCKVEVWSEPANDFVPLERGMIEWDDASCTLRIIPPHDTEVEIPGR